MRFARSTGKAMSNATSHESAQSEPFSAGIELLKTSPAGLIHCATEWIASAKNHYDYEKGHPGLLAAARALQAAPQIFVGSQGPSWDEAPRSQFWATLFAAKAQKAISFDLLAALKPLTKAELAHGAKHMMILAGKSKDSESFESLLALGAVRRSKLVLFSAYQNGSRAVAEKVKQPTSTEALELIELGKRSGWRSSRWVEHDAEGLDWLLSKVTTTLPASLLAKVAAGALDHEFIEPLLSKHWDKIQRDASSPTAWEAPGSAEFKERGALEMAAQFLAAGAPKTAKAAALLAGGLPLWTKMCSQGAEPKIDLVYPAIEGAKVAYRANEKTVEPGRCSRVSAQMACAMSGSEPACAWLRAEFETMKLAWAPAKAVEQFFKSLAAGNAYLDAGLPEVTARGVAASEKADLFHGLAPLAPPPAQGAAKPRSRANAL
jgi:hypothetical protein